MLEKDKSKRAFVVDLFSKFPQSYFKISNEIDLDNYNAYIVYKDAMDRKRMIDGNKHKIHAQYDILKKRFQNDVDEDKKQRADFLKRGITFVGDNISDI